MSAPCFYMHSNGQADPRKPARLSVGPVLSRAWDGSVFFTATTPTVALRDLKRFAYAQPQITKETPQ